jgi:cytoskeletal protein CcmA (bactofilin family)
MNLLTSCRGLMFLCLSALLALRLAGPAWAMDNRSGGNVVIHSDEVINDDLYIFGQSITLDGTVKGDVIAFGGQITLNGVVEGDLVAAGQAIIVNGRVTDDARLAGATVTLGGHANIADDLVSAGYSLETAPESVVAGEAIFAGGQMLHGGNIAGNLKLAVGALQLNGIVGGNLMAEVGEPADRPPFSPFQFMPNAPRFPDVRGGLMVGPGAKVGGNFDYTKRTGVDIPGGIVAGQIVHRLPAVSQTAAETRPHPLVAWFLDNLRNLITLLIAGLLMIWLTPVLTRQSAAILQSKPLPSLGWGLVTVFAVFFILMVLFILVVIFAVIFGVATLGDLLGTTIWLGLFAGFAILLAFGLAVGYVSKIVVSYWGGRWLLARLNPALAGNLVWPLLVGVLVFATLAAIPFLGNLVSLFVSLFGLGALWLLAKERLTPAPAM